MTDIAWNLADLDADAQTWTCVSDRLSEIAEVVGDLTVSPNDLMGFLNSSSAAALTFTRAFEEVSRFARSGSAQTLAGATTLGEVAAAYRANELEAAQAFDDLWEPES